MYHSRGHGFLNRVKASGLGPVRYTLEKGGSIIHEEPKHRYIYFVGTKSFKREMLKRMPWEILPYPKGDSKRHNIDVKISQGRNLNLGLRR